MRFFVSILIACIGWSVMPAGANPVDDIPQQKVRTFINLLDYIGKDYTNAVRDGEVINEFEYQEMINFGRQVRSLHSELSDSLGRPAFSKLDGEISRLNGLIKERADAGEVAGITRTIRDRVLELQLVRVTPREWPDLARGEQMFRARCQSCHGTGGAGDGPLAGNLNPPPTNFQDSANASNLSPMQAYHSIRLGMEGTSMRAFTELSSQQAWDIAFYVNSLNYSEPVRDSLRSAIRQAVADTVSLRSVSVYSNHQWMELFRSKNIKPEKGMAVLRGLASDPSAPASGNMLQTALTLLDKSRSAYRENNYEAARRYALDAYLDGVEPVEGQVSAIAPGLTRELESGMLEIRSAIKNRVGMEQFNDKVRSASLTIEEASSRLENQEYSFWVNFSLSSAILLREGLEAFLIIMVILGVLRSVGAERTVKYVHGGWVAALAAGIGGWFVVQHFIRMSSLQRELMEAIGALIAVAMLLYIGFWMHSKTHISRWKQFVEGRVQGLVNKGSMWGLGLLSFTVVFREAFESIIFLSSIGFQSSGANTGMLAAFLAVSVLITAIGYAFKNLSRNVPIRALFRYSSAMLAVLAVILIGKGIRSLQEAGYMEITTFPWNLNIPLLGIYPTWSTIAAQLLILGAAAGLWYYSNRMASLSVSS